VRYPSRTPQGGVCQSDLEMHTYLQRASESILVDTIERRSDVNIFMSGAGLRAEPQRREQATRVSKTPHLNGDGSARAGMHLFNPSYVYHEEPQESMNHVFSIFDTKYAIPVLPLFTKSMIIIIPEPTTNSYLRTSDRENPCI
jgi:hypothetical protein